MTSGSLLGDSVEGFKNLVLQLYQFNNILHISGASYHPYLPNLLPDTSEYCYEFYGFADTLRNVSLLYIGLPPAAVDSEDTLIFSDYSLSSIIIRRMIRTDLRNLDDTIKSVIVTSYKDSLSLTEILDSVNVAGVSWLRSSDELTAITPEDLDFFLELNKQSNNPDFLTLLILRHLKQPAYFNVRGYVGNGKIVPIEFGELVLTRRKLPLQNPSAVKNLFIVPR